MRLTRARNSAIHEEHMRRLVRAWNFEVLSMTSQSKGQLKSNFWVPPTENSHPNRFLQPTSKIYKAIYDIFAFISDSNMKWCPSIAFCYYICEVWISIQLEIINHFIDHVFCWSLNRVCSRNFWRGI